MIAIFRPRPAWTEALPPFMRILYVEDHREVRETIALLMEAEGRTVVQCETGEQALEQDLLAQERGTPFDVVVTDVSLPGMSGTDLAHALLAKNRERWIVLCSGYELGAHARSWSQVGRITGPAAPVHLSDALGILLRGGVDLLVSQRCRHEDAAAVIDAISGATAGAVVSLWGIDSAHALSRLAALSTVASGAIQALTVALARSVDLLVRVSVGVNGEAMQVIELVEPRVKEGNQIVHMPIFRAMKAQDGATEFRPTGTVPGFIGELAERGINLPMNVFKPDK